MAQLYLDILETKICASDLRDALRSLPGKLDDDYTEAWNRINTQGTDSSTLAIKALRWLVFSFRHLTVDELSHALAVRAGQNSLDKERLVSMNIILGTCQGLVKFDKASPVVRLVHYTTQQYFNDNRARHFPDAHEVITATRLTYLRFQEFAEGPCDFYSSDPCYFYGQKGSIKKSRLLSTRCAVNPFLTYASSHWGNHARESSKGANEEAIQAFLDTPEALSSCAQANVDFCYNLEKGNEITGALNMLVQFGLHDILERRLNGRSLDDLDIDGLNRQVLLFNAARLDNPEIVDLLLKVGATMSLGEAI